MEQDSPWKEVIEDLFEDFLAFFFPDLHRAIDFTRPPEFLENELQQIAVESETGKRVIDKLVKVYLRSGGECWLLIHLEFQGYPEKGFPERMYIYNYRIFDKFRRDVISLAVLTDDNPAFRPSEYSRVTWGTEVSFRYTVIKLLDYREHLTDLETNPNPFAMVVRAFLRALETEGNFQERYAWKKRFLLELYHVGMPRETIRVLYKFIDWIMRLPEGLEQELFGEMEKAKEVNKMSYITTAERIGMARGVAQGVAQGIAQSIAVVLEIKFGEAGENLTQRVQQAQRAEMLQKFLEGLKQAPSLSEAERMFSELEQQVSTQPN